MNEKSTFDLKKDRKFFILLYPDSTDYDCSKVLEYIAFNYDFAYIKHDSDLNEKGELKKVHIHLVLKFKSGSPRYRSGLAKELGIDKRYIEPLSKLDEGLLYLIHFNDKSKHQYSVDNVIGNLKGKLVNLVEYNDYDEGSELLNLIDYINSCDEYITVSMFIQYCVSNGFLKTFHKYSYSLLKILDEHNRPIKKF